MSSMDFAQLAKNANTVLEGDFPVTITEATAKKASTGNLMIAAKVKIESGPFANRPVYANIVLAPDSPNAVKRFFNTLDTLGLGVKFFEGMPKGLEDEQQMAFIAQALINKRAIVTLGEREWNGVKSEEIQAWKPAVGGSGVGGGAKPTSAAQSLAPKATTAQPLANTQRVTQAAVAAAEEQTEPVTVPAGLSTEPPADPF